MKQNERAGIMRIVSDIVKADSIIDLREIDYLDGIKDKYRITKDDEAMGDSMTLLEIFTIWPCQTTLLVEKRGLLYLPS